MKCFGFRERLTRRIRGLCLAAIVIAAPASALQAATNVYLTEVPDYSWYAGCFGTACGNLMGFWDRHGLPDLYTGPTSDGVAPLTDFGGNSGIRSMWATKAGFDGRPSDKPGHIDDYWGWYDDDITYSYESTAPDPYEVAGRPEHEPDCIGDFIGLSQNRWKGMNGECDGNIDAYSFVYWDSNGTRRVNFVPSNEAGVPARDLQSGLREWMEFRGYDAEVFTQLADINPAVPPGAGFTFEDLKREIDAGYPVLLFLQRPEEMSRALGDMPEANPQIHGMLAFGYYISDQGSPFVRYRSSWADGDALLRPWAAVPWELRLPLRGVIGFHPHPKITHLERDSGMITLEWDGPSAQLNDGSTTRPVHRYVVEKSDRVGGPYETIKDAQTERTAVVPTDSAGTHFFRVRLVEAPEG